MAEQRPTSNIHYGGFMCLNEINSWRRCCVITIVNDTIYTLTNGQSARTSGKVHRDVPPTIKSRQEGIVLSRKTSYSLRGAVGMVSYQIQGLNSDNDILQIAWHVPWDTLSSEVFFNVNLGNTTASKSEVHKLLFEIPTETRRLAKDYTPGSFDIGEFRFEVAMLDAKQSILTIKIKDI